MNQEQVIAPVEQTAPPAADEQKIDAVDSQQDQQAEDQKPQASEPEDPDKLPKWAKTRDRSQQRRISSLQRRLGEYEARIAEYEQRTGGLQSRGNSATNGIDEDDSGRAPLSQSELDELVTSRARELSAQETEMERRRRVAEGLVKDLGKDKFVTLTDDLEAALGGLELQKGRFKPAVDAIFRASNPRGVMEYLADPDNEAEALRLSRMNDAIDAGMAIAAIDNMLKAKANAKPEPSKAPAPIDLERGRGKIDNDPSQMSDAEFAAWRRRQIAQRR